LRGLTESDAVNKARLTIMDMKTEENKVVVRPIWKNEGYRLLGIDEWLFASIPEFHGRRMEKVKLESPPAREKLRNDGFKQFAEWAKKEHLRNSARMKRAAIRLKTPGFFIPYV
jgi:hypothetical protein